MRFLAGKLGDTHNTAYLICQIPHSVPRCAVLGSVRNWVGCAVVGGVAFGSMRYWECAVLGMCGIESVRYLGVCGIGSVRYWECAVLGVCGTGSVWYWECALLGVCDIGSVRY